MTAEIEQQPGRVTGAGQRPAPAFGRGVRLGLGRFTPHLFTSLTRRIISYNLAALVILVLGIMFLNQFRAGLIDSRVNSLLVQGEIIAGAVAASATVDVDTVLIDPEELLDLEVGQSTATPASPFGELEFSINPERVAPVLRRLISPTGTRARIYDAGGTLILDSRRLYARGRVLSFALPPPPPPKETLRERLWREFNSWLSARDLPLYRELAGRDGRGYDEVVAALDGGADSVVRRTEAGDLIVSVGVPIRRGSTVHGVLLLSTEGDDIDKIVIAERLAIMRVFLLAAGVSVLLSVILAFTIAAPLRRLADAANRVRRRTTSRPVFPNLAGRGDEIGHLTQAMRDMTSALFNRMAAIENFAADVAHELKNPLTSLRSAVETLPLVKTENERQRLTAVILHDIRRMDRLISDISDASRLDAELAREEAVDVDLRRVIDVVVGMAHDHRSDCELELTYADSDDNYAVRGHDGRIGQVFNNLIDNACSFAGDGGKVTVRVARVRDRVEISVEDTGPGIRDEQFERIFERFYTDRADKDGFGQNSGLGLSISRQIVEAHAGTIRAENRLSDDGEVLGARFVVCLPTDDGQS